MDVQNLLSHEPYPRRRSDLPTSDLQEAQRAHQYPTRHSVQTTPDFRDVQTYSNAQASPTYPALPLSHPSGQNQSPTKADPKNITFELLFDGDLRYRARLPMKVQIFPHDNTDGIVSTVKNFFGLYDEAIGGVSFEDFKGNTMIASYDNFQNGMAVFVRVLPGISQTWSGNQEGVETARTYPRSDGPHLDEGFQMLPPQSVPHQAQTISRPASRIAPRQSPSPQLNGFQRHPSIQKGRPRPPFKRDSRESSFQARLDELNSDSFKGNQSSDGDAASVTSSFRARNELVASAEISEANIVEGGRRQKAKFESSELPLFVPPQVPAPHSVSSISPQRRSNGNEHASPFAHPSQNASYRIQNAISPQYAPYGAVGLHNVPPRIPAPAHGHRLRDRVNPPIMPANLRGAMSSKSPGYGILPTPDPTIASTISDEDVALQLMRLGDPANMSHGRTSASTMDDSFSGRADIASSATSDGDGSEMNEGLHGPATHSATNNNRKRPASTTVPEASGDESYNHAGHSIKRPKLNQAKTLSTQIHAAKKPKTSKPRSSAQTKKVKSLNGSSIPKVPISPASLPPPSRKGSTASLMGPPQLPFADDEDLSTKPRCQRCRKSKKGCDRQRPCQRCKDAGIGVEGCISEDEGNGRKGRFGRHMGVAVQKDGANTPLESTELTVSHEFDENTLDSQNNNKKRKI